MGHGDADIGQEISVLHQNRTRNSKQYSNDFVLEKSIFSNVFEKDIKRVFIYKKAERLAKAVHLITPAFEGSMSLRNRVDSVAIGLVDAAILPLSLARPALYRELLALSSVLAIARTGGILSTMNAEIIEREARTLLQEVAGYEEPRLHLEETPSLAALAKNANLPLAPAPSRAVGERGATSEKNIKDISDNSIKDRKGAVMDIIRDKGKVGIKDISALIRGVSEKTIQRELSALVAAGVVKKEGERRWSTYSLIPR